MRNLVALIGMFIMSTQLGFESLITPALIVIGIISIWIVIMKDFIFSK